MRVQVRQKVEEKQKRPVVVQFPDGTRKEISAETPQELAQKIGNELKKAGVRSFRFKVNGKDVDVAEAGRWLPPLIDEGGFIEVVPVAEAG